MTLPHPGVPTPPPSSTAPTISFILPAHNEEALIGRALDSIATAARSLAEPFEVIVVDDASTDRTAVVAEEHRARVIPVAHRQIARARNAGAKAASGDLFIFVDADTFVRPRVVRTAVRALRNKVLVGGGCCVELEGPLPLYGRVIDHLLRAVAPAIGLAGGCFFFCTRAAFDAAGGFDESLFAAEEVALAGRLKRLGRFVVLRQTVVTSGRKLRAHSAADMLGLFLRLARAGTESLKKREGLEFWYGPRGEGVELAPTGQAACATRPDHGNRP